MSVDQPSEDQSANPEPEARPSKAASDADKSKSAGTKYTKTTSQSGSTRNAKSAEKDSDRARKDQQADKNDKTEKTEPWVSEETLTSFFDRITDVTSSAFRFAKKTTDTSYKVGKAIMQSQDQLKLMVAAGQSLKDLREVAGLTVTELSDAINLKDKSLLEAVENGTATLSFELILRLSALLARNDPIPFILKYSRTYSPETWKLLNDWGAGRLPLQYQREREFINIYRSKDEARQLSDEGFAKVLEFTRHAFNMSLHFIAEQEQALQHFQNDFVAAQGQGANPASAESGTPTEKASRSPDETE